MNVKGSTVTDSFWQFLVGPRDGGKEAALAPKPYWSPYAAGVLLGVTLFLAFFIMGRGLGASGPLNRLVVFSYALIGEELAQGFSYYRPYFAQAGSVLADYSVFQLIGVLVGGYLSAAMARRVKLTVEKGPRIDVRSRLWLAFAGGFVMAWGARIARGCTSGQVLTGSANLAIGSLVMFVFFFAGAYATAYLVRKQWI